MPEKIVLFDDQEDYRLEVILARGEPHQGEYSCNIFVSKEDRGNKVISLTQSQDYDAIFKNLGIIVKGDDFRERFHSLAVQAGKNYANHLRCLFEDNSSYEQSQSSCTKASFSVV